MKKQIKRFFTWFLGSTGIVVILGMVGCQESIMKSPDLISKAISIDSLEWGDKVRGFIVLNRKNSKIQQHQTAKTQPLPHNGLFIRRNNAFGTKMTTSIKELLAQGVMIEHKKIRFDDFVALNTSGIPSPSKNRALAVSYGITPILAHQKRDSRATHYLEIALKTTNTVPLAHPETKAPPVNYIFVIDISGSMSGEKLETVKAAIKKLFNSLKGNDIIGVIAFDDKVKTILTATPVKRIAPAKFGKLISKLSSDGGTDINLGLSYGINEISRFDDNKKINQIFLFSDGNPTSGETN